MYTLDSLVDRLKLSGLGLIRMDIEGAEVIAIEGMMRMLQKFRPRIVMELHPPLVGKEKILDLLTTPKELGYRQTVVFPRGMDFASPSPWTKRAHWKPMIENLETLVHRAVRTRR